MLGVLLLYRDIAMHQNVAVRVLHNMTTEIWNRKQTLCWGPSSNHQLPLANPMKAFKGHKEVDATVRAQTYRQGTAEGHSSYGNVAASK